MTINSRSIICIGLVAAALAWSPVGCERSAKTKRSAGSHQVQVIGPEIAIRGEDPVAFMLSPSGGKFLCMYMLEKGNAVLLSLVDTTSQEVWLEEIGQGVVRPRWLGQDVLGLFSRHGPPRESFAMRVPSFERLDYTYPIGGMPMTVDGDLGICCIRTENNDVLVLDHQQKTQVTISATDHGLDDVRNIVIAGDRLLINGRRDDGGFTEYTQLWSIPDVKKIREYLSEEHFPPGWGIAARQIGSATFCWPVRPGMWELANLADGQALYRFGEPVSSAERGGLRPSTIISDPGLVADTGFFVQVRKTASSPDATIALVHADTGLEGDSFLLPHSRLDGIYVSKAGGQWLLLCVTTKQNAANSHYWQVYELPHMRPVGNEVELPWASRHHRQLRNGVLWLAIGRSLLSYDFAAAASP